MKTVRKMVVAVAALLTALMMIMPSAHAKTTAGQTLPVTTKTPPAIDNPPPDDFAPQGPYSPWYGSVTIDLALRTDATQPPLIFPSDDNAKLGSGNRALVYMSIRDGINSATNACVYGIIPPGPGISGPDCLNAPDAHGWPTFLCDQI